MSDYLDAAGRKDVTVITLAVSRRWALRCGAKPKVRGGPLFFRDREIVCIPIRRSKPQEQRSWLP